MFIGWFYRRWVALTLGLGVLSLLLLPVPIDRLHWNTFLVLVYLETPIYMLHQVEEHTGDRFRTFVNRQIYGGVEALTPTAVLVVNIPGVWGVTLLSLWLATCVAAGWGLIGLYLVAVNGVVHLVGAIVFRKYNPGLWTALLLFLPLSAVTFWKSAATQATWIQHAVGLGVAIAIHVALVVYTRARATQLRAQRA